MKKSKILKVKPRSLIICKVKFNIKMKVANLLLLKKAMQIAPEDLVKASSHLIQSAKFRKARMKTMIINNINNISCNKNNIQKNKKRLKRAKNQKEKIVKKKNKNLFNHLNKH